jgi:hypothetical protein
MNLLYVVVHVYRSIHRNKCKKISDVAHQLVTLFLLEVVSAIFHYQIDYSEQPKAIQRIIYIAIQKCLFCHVCIKISIILL